MEKFLKQYSLFIVIVAVCMLSTFIVTKRCSTQLSRGVISNGTEYVDSANVYNKIYTDEEFKSLRKENKKLYDSLKASKNQINYLLQFKYDKSYSSGKVDIGNKAPSLEAKDYVYESTKNDSFEYKLTINSEKEPNYYKLDARFKEKFTIVNKNQDGMNHTTIQGDGKGDIKDVTVFNKKQKTKFADRFSVGPSVTFGYDPIHKNIGCMVGVSLTYNLFSK